MKTRVEPLSDTRVVATSMGVSIFDACRNLLVAILTGSTTVLAQTLQSTSDLLVGGILYLGVKRSKREADKEYQFGYGRELFFWVLMGGVLMFVGTGLLSVYFGYRQFIVPEPVHNIIIAFATVALGLVTNFYALYQSIQRLHQLDPHTHWWSQLLHSSIIETKATLLVDFMGTAAALFGLIALTIYQITGNGQFDGLGSMIIGISMMFAAVLLIIDVQDLIVGRSVDAAVATQIKQATESVEGVVSVIDLHTMYIGSSRLLVIIEVQIDDGLETNSIAHIVDAIQSTVHSYVPQAQHIHVEVETPDVTLTT